MRELFSNVQFAKPFFFWLLLALPLLWFRLRDQRFSIVIWRTLILLLFIVILADPQSVTEQTRHEERIFAFDLSQSIPESMHRWMESTADSRFSPNQQDRIFVFGSETREVTNWREWLKGENSEQSSIRPGKTSLEKLFTTLLELPAAPRSLFIFTDGWETQGNVEHLLPAIAGSGLKIYPILPAGPPKIANVAVTKLLAPTYGNSGEALNLKVVLENQNEREVDGTLTLTRNGQTFKTDSVKLKPGSQIFTYQTTLSDGSPTSFYRASFTPRRADFDRYAADNQALAWVTVRSKAKVLLLNGRSGGGRYLEEIFKRLGFEVTSRTADSPPAPTGYQVVVFNNAEREKFSTSYLASIERHVAAGNGFLMLGDEASFAPGSYRRTPIENILPVEPREPKREEKNRAVVLVIDKSGSMREQNKMLYALEAAKVLVRQLKDNDLLGVVAFDVSPFIVVPMESVGRLRSTFNSQIDRLRPGGQTYIYPALLEAKRQLERQNAAIKHVILLSDGETRGSQSELIDLVSVMKNEMKITVSGIAVGAEADIRLMKRVSQYGGGLFHYTLDPSTLPQIVLQQIQDKPTDEPPRERDFTPLQERGSQLLSSFPTRSYPTIRGYMETDLKRGAHLDLMIPRDDRKAPLLASWQYERGKSIALTTDLEGRWSRNWIQWNELQNFLGKILDWLRPSEEPIPLHEARVSLSASQPVLELFAYEEASADSQFRFSVIGKSGRSEGTLRKLAPGHYQAELPISVPGDYRIELTEERRGRRIPYPPIGYTLPYDRESEIARPEFNTNLLIQLAQATGGEINPESPDKFQKQDVTRNYQPMRQPLIVLAFVLFLLEIAARKLLLSEID
ncbi:MAG: VWA domain-containing protein [Deltaproteobacteria bacterium]|nr:MAG: VWA domain-containing protein [Deltaproteobacteria bacterium]